MHTDKKQLYLLSRGRSCHPEGRKCFAYDDNRQSHDPNASTFLRLRRPYSLLRLRPRSGAVPAEGTEEPESLPEGHSRSRATRYDGQLHARAWREVHILPRRRGGTATLILRFPLRSEAREGKGPYDAPHGRCDQWRLSHQACRSTDPSYHRDLCDLPSRRY